MANVQMYDIKDSPLHEYQERINDHQGNAKESYLIDLNDSRIKQLI